MCFNSLRDSYKNERYINETRKLFELYKKETKNKRLIAQLNREMSVRISQHIDPLDRNLFS